MKFKAKDFEVYWLGEQPAAAAAMAALANKRLAEMLAEAPKVYGWNDGSETDIWFGMPSRGDKDTHTARIVAVRESETPNAARCKCGYELHVMDLVCDRCGAAWPGEEE